MGNSLWWGMARMRRMVSKPSISGSIMSINTTSISGREVKTSMPAWPFSAKVTSIL